VGATGATGPSGPSVGLQFYTYPIAEDITLPTSWQVLCSAEGLPAGTYFIAGSADIHNPAEGGDHQPCMVAIQYGETIVSIGEAAVPAGAFASISPPPVTLVADGATLITLAALPAVSGLVAVLEASIGTSSPATALSVIGS
jgi:hypothetical protein